MFTASPILKSSFIEVYLISPVSKCLILNAFNVSQSSNPVKSLSMSSISGMSEQSNLSWKYCCIFMSMFSNFCSSCPTNTQSSESPLKRITSEQLVETS